MLKSRFQNPFLKYCRCLSPSNRKSTRSSKDIALIAKHLPLEIKTDTLSDEWTLLSFEADVSGSKDMRIDEYWSQFLSMKSDRGEPKYPLISLVVKATLSVSHGNADVERGFSTSGRILSDDRASMSERTLDALMTIKGALRSYDNRPHLVPITKNLLMMAHRAYQSYKLYLDDEKRKKEEKQAEKLREDERQAEEEKSKQQITELKSTIDKKQEELKILRKDEDEKRRTADKLFTEANNRLKKAIEKHDMTEVELAQAMLEGVSTVRKQQESHKRAADNVQEVVEKKKERLITNFFAKKPK